MKLLKSTLMASALILGTASVSFAQDSMTDKAKDMAVDKATDMAKDKATDMAGEKAGKMVDPAMKAGKHMMKGDSAKDAMKKTGASMMKDEAKSYGSGTAGKVMGEGASMDGKDAMTAGKVMLKGGSKEDAAMAVAKSKAKDAMMEKGEAMMKDKMMQGGTIKTSAPSYGSGSQGDTMMKKDDHMMKDGMKKSYGSATPATAPAPAIPPLNCPAGTTAQANGTCMVTGNYVPRS